MARRHPAPMRQAATAVNPIIFIPPAGVDAPARQGASVDLGKR